MKAIRHANGRDYMPRVYTDGKLRADVMAAYGNYEMKGMLMLSVYLHSTAQQGSRMRTYRVLAMREWAPIDCGVEHQKERVAFMLDVVATQQECELKLVKPMSLRG